MLHLRSTEYSRVAKRATGPFVAKKSRCFKFDEVTQRFRLTPTEIRVALFVFAALGLGLLTKCYRDAHPSPAPAAREMGHAKSMMGTKAKRASPARSREEVIGDQ